MVIIKSILINSILLNISLCVTLDKSYGNKLSNDSSKYCKSKLCILDSNRLLESSTDNSSLSPCDNFKEYSMGKFIKYRALHDRYDRTGFLFDILVTYRERHRKLLQTPIENLDSRVYKVAKNFFQKCVDPKYIKNQGKFEVAEYLKDYQLPMIDGADWWPDLANITSNIFLPSWKLEFFTAYKITRCTHPNDPDSEIVCLKFNHEFDFLHKIMLKYKEKTRLDFIQRLRETDFMLRVDQNLVNSSIDHLFDYVERRLALNYPGRLPTVPYVLKINQINDVLIPSTTLKLDWFQLINTVFLDHSKAYSGEEEVLIEDWELFGQSMELLETYPVRLIMDCFHLGFLYGFEHVYTVYPLSRIDVYKRGTQKDYQRYEQCLQLLESTYSPVLISQYIRSYMKQEDLDAAESFVKTAVNNVAEEVVKDDSLDTEIVDDVRRKLKKMVIILAVSKDVLDESNLENMYQELELSGDEGLLETTIKLKKYTEKLDNESKRSWFHQANQFSQLSHMKYFPEKDVIFIPADYLQYPYYDKSRPRFYNTATLFTEVVLSINEGLKSYLKSQYNVNYKLNYDSIQLGYKNYVQWEENSGESDLKLPGFSLTNRQMYWLSFANSYFMKYHSNVPFVQLDALRLQYEHFHVWFKARDEFREAFECNEMTQEEIDEFEVLKKKFNKVFRQR